MNERQQTIIKEMNRYLDGISIEIIKNRRGDCFRFPVYMSASLMDADIAELELSVRSFNCLKRAGCNKLGDLIEKIDGKKDLLRIRNLGNRSADEIMTQIMIFQYMLLKPEKRKMYLKRILELNEYDNF